MIEQTKNLLRPIICVAITVLSIIGMNRSERREFSFLDHTGQRVVIEKDARVAFVPLLKQADLTAGVQPHIITWYEVRNLYKDDNGALFVYLVDEPNGVELTMQVSEFRQRVVNNWKILIVPQKPAY